MTPDKRKYKRVKSKLNLSCRDIEALMEPSYSGQTINVSPGGLYFETESNCFEPGRTINIRLSIPPTAGLLESGGGISANAKVLRIVNIPDSLRPVKYGIAVEFCQAPKLRT